MAKSWCNDSDCQQEEPEAPSSSLRPGKRDTVYLFRQFRLIFYRHILTSIGTFVAVNSSCKIRLELLRTALPLCSLHLWAHWSRWGNVTDSRAYALIKNLGDGGRISSAPIGCVPETISCHTGNESGEAAAEAPRALFPLCGSVMSRWQVIPSSVSSVLHHKCPPSNGRNDVHHTWNSSMTFGGKEEAPALTFSTNVREPRTNLNEISFSGLNINDLKSLLRYFFLFSFFFFFLPLPWSEWMSLRKRSQESRDEEINM